MNTLDLFTNINPANIKNAFLHFRAFGLRSVVRKIAKHSIFNVNYKTWLTHHTLSANEIALQANHNFISTPLISIIVPVYKTPPLFLEQMINSVISQTYKNWELCIADGSAMPSTSYIKEIVTEHQKKHHNIQYVSLETNRGISGNTNAALALATGDYIALLDHDDILTPNALYEVVDALNKEPCIDVLYSDEDKTNPNFTLFYDPYFKPDFNLDLLRSCNYITHFYTVRKSLADAVGGFDATCDGSQDYDFILKTCEKANKICHIPKILYHWRIHPTSVAGNPESKNYAYDSAVHALQNHLKRCNEKGVVSKGTVFGFYDTNYSLPSSPKISIIMIDCSSCVKEQLFNFISYKYIEIVSSLEEASGEYFTILYKTKELLSPDLIEQLLSNCSRSSVGLAGVKSYYKKGRVLDAGLIFTSDGKLHSPFYKYYDNDPGYCYRAKIQQSCSFVGPYCFMIKASVFKTFSAPNFTEDFLSNFWQLCYTLCQNQLSVLLIPQVSVISLDKNRELPILEYCRGTSDPFYNPNFSEHNMYRLS